MNGGQQNQSGYSSGFYGSNSLPRQNQERFGNTSFGGGNMYSMHQPHNAFSHQMADTSPIKISPNVPDTSVEQFSMRQKLDNNMHLNSYCITSIDRYTPYAIEELRCADYKKGRKGTIVSRPSRFHSPYGASNPYMQKQTDLSGTGAFGQNKPDTTSSFASLAQTGFGTPTRTPGQSIFSSGPSNTSSPSMFGQSQTTGSFMTKPNQSFLNQPSSTSFQQNSPLGGFGSFGQGAAGMQPPKPTNMFGVGNPPEQQTFSSSGFLNKSSMLGSGTVSSQQQSSGLGMGQFGSGIGGVNNQTTGSTGSLGPLGGHSSIGQSTNNSENVFSLGNANSGSGTLFGGQQQNALGGGLGGLGSSSFSQIGSQTGIGQPAGTSLGSLGNSGNSGLETGLRLGQPAQSIGVFGASGFGTQGAGSTQQSGGLGSPFGQNSLDSSKSGNSSILGISGLGGLGASKPSETATAPQFSFGGTLGSQDLTKNTFGTGLGDTLSKPLGGSGTNTIGSIDTSAKPAGLFSSNFGTSAASSLGSGTGLQTQMGSSFGLSSGFGSGGLGDSKLTQTARATATDPYLMNSLDFKECEEYKKKSYMEIPAPLFKKASMKKIKFKALGGFKEFLTLKEKTREKRNLDIIADLEEDEYYTIPSIEKIKKMSNKKIAGFIIGRKNHGKLEFLEEVDLTHMNLDSIIPMVNIEDSYIFFNFDAEEMPPGKGINKQVQITLENVVPYSHSSGSMKKLKETDPFYEKIKQRVIANLPKEAKIESVFFNAPDGVIRITCPHLWVQK